MKPETFTTIGDTVTINGEVFVRKAAQQKQKGYFMPKFGEMYHFVAQTGSIDWDIFDSASYDKDTIANSPIFRTTQEAEFYRYYNQAKLRVIRAILELNEGWVPDWSDGVEGKWDIEYNYELGRFTPNDAYFLQGFLSLPYCKTEEIAQEIIDNHKSDLEIIRLYQF